MNSSTPSHPTSADQIRTFVWGDIISSIIRGLWEFYYYRDGFAHKGGIEPSRSKDPAALASALNTIKVFQQELGFENPKNLVAHISSIVSDRDYEIFIGRIRDGKTLEEIAKEMSITREGCVK